MKIQNIRLDKLRVNDGQIEGLPKNPRFIKDDRFKKLVKSIEDDPEMLSLREMIVYPFKDSYVIICGNMRYRAMKHIGYKEAPCKVLPPETTVEKLQAYAIKDNVPFGSDDWDLLANEWDEVKLAEWGMELPEEKEKIDLSDNVVTEYRIEVFFDNEANQEVFYNEMNERGIRCRILTL